MRSLIILLIHLQNMKNWIPTIFYQGSAEVRREGSNLSVLLPVLAAMEILPYSR